MKRSKRLVLLVLGVCLAAALIAAGCIGLRVAPTVNHALRISELLQPILDAENQAMHIAVSAELDGKPLALESDAYRVAEDGDSYLAIEQNGTAVYVADNVLFLENGKAFKLGDKLQTQTASYSELLPQIGALYNALTITAEEKDDCMVYKIAVSADQMDTLLAAAALGGSLPTAGIQTLDLSLTERNGKLDAINFSGCATADGISAVLNVTLSNFRILAPGDYPIPAAVKQSAAAVDPNELFSLTEDLYRLVRALAPFAQTESIEGTLALSVDCGLIQLDTELQLSDLQTSSGRVDPEQLRALPELLGWLCMEGDITCRQDGKAYVYVLKLDQKGMQQLSRMILPELAGYGGNLTEGDVTVILEDNKISSMRVSIDGKISALIAQIPIGVQAEFFFE